MGLLDALTIYRLDASDIIRMQHKVDTVTSVDRSHQSASELRVTQAQGVANFMGSYNTQISTII